MTAPTIKIPWYRPTLRRGLFALLAFETFLLLAERCNWLGLVKDSTGREFEVLTLFTACAGVVAVCLVAFLGLLARFEFYRRFQYNLRSLLFLRGSSAGIADCYRKQPTGLGVALKVIGGIYLASHTLGILIATIAAWNEIRSIMLWGVILAPTGLGIAFFAFRGCRPIGFYYGLSAPTATVTCSAIIGGFAWSPSDAQIPIVFLLALFNLVFVPVGVVAIVELYRSRPMKQPLPAQFGISSLLGTMLFVSLFFGCVRVESQQGMAIVGVVGYTIFVWRAVTAFRRGQASVDARADRAILPTPGCTTNQI